VCAYQTVAAIDLFLVRSVTHGRTLVEPAVVHVFRA
jgi:hypothetical protein